MSLQNPTKDERAYMQACKEFCIVCYMQGHGKNPAHFHHMLSGGKRISHLHGFGLCPTHHNSGVNDFVAVSRHPYKATFEKRYGTEAQLLEKTRELVREFA